jgi:predicted dehydrogenase
MEKLKVGIIGSRFAATLHANAYQRCPEVEITAAAAIDNLEPFCEKFGIKNSYRDYQKLLRHPEIRLVSICVPNYLHKEVAIASAEAGKNIICEKPLATTLSDAKEVVRVCRERGVKLMYAEDWVFAPALRRAAEICEEGALGKIFYIKAKETHPGSHSQYAQKINFCGGGAMIHLAIHPIGWVRWFKKQEVVEVTGQITPGGKRNLKHAHFEGEDWGIATLKFEDNSYALVEGNYITCGGLDDVVEIYGSEGVIKVELSQGSPLSVFSLRGYSYAIEKAELTKGWTRPAVDEEASLGYPGEIEHFVDCVRKDKEPMFGVRGDDGVRALEIVTAIYRSAQEKRTITLPIEE